MGAAIECFPDACAVDIPRSRFAPVKTTSDLLTLRSDAYEITVEGRAVLAPECQSVPPNVELDGSYKLVDQLEAALVHGVPSLKECRSLVIHGPVTFEPGTVLRGAIRITNPSSTPQAVPAGTYTDTDLTLGN